MSAPDEHDETDETDERDDATGPESSDGPVAVGREVAAAIKADRVPLTAAGVAYFAFLAVIPALVAVVSIYGLVGDPDSVRASVEDVAGALPEEVADLVIEQLESITRSSSSALTVGLVVSLVAALWAASSGMGHLMEALNVVFGETEGRGFLVKRATAVVLTLGAVAFGIVAIGAITVWPVVVNSIGPPSPFGWLLRLAVWPVLAAGLAASLAVLYRVGPDRSAARVPWLSPGAGVAVVVWVAASVGFQFYAGNFGSYNETYGSLGAIVIMLVWLWISALALLLGAEVNSVLDARGRAASSRADTVR